MRFSMIAADLAQYIQRMAKVTPARTTYPILNTVLFRLEGNQLSLRATDTEVDYVLKLLVEGEEDGEICVPLRLLMEITQVLGDVPLVFDEQEQRLTLKTSAGTYRIFGRDPSEFPEAPPVEQDLKIKLPFDRLTKIIKKTRSFVSQNEMKPALLGVLLEFQGNTLQAVATDGHRLVKYTQQDILETALDRKLIVTPKFLDLLTTLADKENQEVELTIGQDHIRAEIPEHSITARLINETYPDYENVIPQANDKVFLIEKEALMQTVRRVSVFASKATHQIAVELKAGLLTVSTEDPEVNSSAKEDLLIDYSGPELKLGYNAMYLRDVLNNIDSEKVIFRLGSDVGPGIIEPEEKGEKEDLLMLLMPIRIRQ